VKQKKDQIKKQLEFIGAFLIVDLVLAGYRRHHLRGEARTGREEFELVRAMCPHMARMAVESQRNDLAWIH